MRPPGEQRTDDDAVTHRIRPVVGAGWLSAHLDRVTVADVRWYLDGRSGRAAHEQGHVPGAVFVDLDRDLAGPATAGAGRHPLPAPEDFARAMGALGIGDEDVVVAYDDAGGVVASRLVWMLRATGRGAALLDGGLQAWPGPLEAGSATPFPALLTARTWPPASLADLADLAGRAGRAAATDGTAVLLDARERERYRGDVEPVDARAGHIPGAVNLPCRENLTAAGTFLPVDELRRRFAAVGVGAATPVVSSCGSGVTACHTLLALEHAGLGPGRLFPGSWSQYSAQPHLPVATGDVPG